MRRTLIGTLVIAALAGGTAAAEDRLAVLEFLARQSTYCIAGAPAVIALQGETAGRAVLLEYDFDAPLATARFQVYRAADPYGAYLPLVMVGSGYRTASGPVDYETTYRGMIDAELARPPGASVAAWWRRVGDGLRLYVGGENLSGAAIGQGDGASVWVLAWENARIRLTDTWVRAAVRSPLAGAVATGGRFTATVDTPALYPLSWDDVACLAMVERRVSSAGRYDTLQAAVAQPAALAVTPAEVALGSGAAAAVVTLAGPPPLLWSASPDVPWLTVEPASGAVPGTAEVRLVPGALPPGTSTGSVRFDAEGDGMQLAAAVSVSATAEGPRGTIRRRLRSVPVPQP